MIFAGGARRSPPTPAQRGAGARKTCGTTSAHPLQLLRRPDRPDHFDDLDLVREVIRRDVIPHVDPMAAEQIGFRIDENFGG